MIAVAVGLCVAGVVLVVAALVSVVMASRTSREQEPEESLRRDGRAGGAP